MKYHQIYNTDTMEIFEYPADKISATEFWGMVANFCDDPNYLVYKGIVEHD